MNVLVVEDDFIIGLGLVTALQDEGHMVIGPCVSAEAARKSAAECVVDLALVDIDLADGPTGGQLAQHLKRHHGCPVIFTTGQVHVAEKWGDNAIGVLAKPIQTEDLLTCVRSLERSGTGNVRTWPRSLRPLGGMGNVARRQAEACRQAL